MSEEQAASEAAAAAAATAAGLRWYVVHAYSGMEKAVERNLSERIDRSGMQDKFGRILVPTEEVVELKGGKKRRHRAPLLPRLRAGRDGDGRRHLAPGEAHQQGHRLRRRRAQPAGADLRSRGDEDRLADAGRRREAQPKVRVARWARLVRVKEGPFTDFNGAVEDVNYEKSKVARVGDDLRPCDPVELDFAQVEKV